MKHTDNTTNNDHPLTMSTLSIILIVPIALLVYSSYIMNEGFTFSVIPIIIYTILHVSYFAIGYNDKTTTSE